MFRESSAIDSERTAASVRSLYSKYASAEDNWFDGTPDSIDRRIAQCKKISNLSKAASVRLSGRNASSQYIALAHEMDGDRTALEGLRRDLLTAGMDREEFSPTEGISPEAYEFIRNRAEGGGFGGRSPEEVIDSLLRQQEGFRGTPYYDGHHPNELVKGWQEAQEYENSPDYRDITDSLADKHMAGKRRAEARYFIAEQECDDLRELTIRAQRHAERLSSAAAPKVSAAFVSSFVNAVRNEYQPPRQQRTANYSAPQDFPADLMFLE